jgi:hypothetical protein
METIGCQALMAVTDFQPPRPVGFGGRANVVVIGRHWITRWLHR